MGQRNLVLVAMVTNEYMLRPCYFTNRLIKNVSTVNTSAYLFYSFHLCKNHRKARALESTFIVFCKFYKIFQNIFITEHFQANVSAIYLQLRTLLHVVSEVFIRAFGQLNSSIYRNSYLIARSLANS